LATLAPHRVRCSAGEQLLLIGIAPVAIAPRNDILHGPQNNLFEFFSESNPAF
jgi:hypothetical protein